MFLLEYLFIYNASKEYNIERIAVVKEGKLLQKVKNIPTPLHKELLPIVKILKG